MKAIGGYFELECGDRPLYHQDGIYINIGRNALRYLIRALRISKIHVPQYTCGAVIDAIIQEGCCAEYYPLGPDLLPAVKIPLEDYIIYNNYFGVLGQQVEEMVKKYPYLVVDNAQAFYSKKYGRASIYSPRKFFGLPDGGILCGSDIPLLDLNQGHSSGLCSHLLRRWDYDAQSGYQDFLKNEEQLYECPVEYMSSLTMALMGNIDYERVRKARLSNFRILQDNLRTSFPIAFSGDDVPSVFPLLLDDGASVRSKLIKNNIFCAQYWPNVIDTVNPKSLEYRLATDLVLLPIDQRYSNEDMQRIIDVVNC